MTLRGIGEPLDAVPTVALCGGAALYLLGHVAFLFRATKYLFRRRTLGAVVLLALIPAAIAIAALASLALVSTTCALVVGYEAIHHRAGRAQVRHPDRPAYMRSVCLAASEAATATGPTRSWRLPDGPAGAA